jgi:hypothetical protein
VQPTNSDGPPGLAKVTVAVNLAGNTPIMIMILLGLEFGEVEAGLERCKEPDD